MTRNMLIDVRLFTDAQREAIAAAATARGFRAIFSTTDDEALAAAADAEIILGANLALPKAAPNLKWLCVPSAGVEPYLPREAYANPDAVLTNSSGAYGVTIAEHTVMVTLELMRRQMEYSAIVAAHSWELTLPIRGIRGSRVTLLGTGDIGQEVLTRVNGFGPKCVVGVNRSGKNPGGMFERVITIDKLDEILPETDLLIMSLPGTKETNGLMDERRLQLLPADAFIVNVGRGNAIDQKALEKLMRAGHLSGAALDVFEVEPMPADDTLWDCPRVLITPHCAGNMTLAWTVERIACLFMEDFENYCDGKPMNRLVDRSLGY